MARAEDEEALPSPQPPSPTAALPFQGPVNLSGGADQSFVDRLQKFQSYVPMMALMAISTARCWHLLTPACTAWLVVYLLACGGALVWQHLGAPTSHARWRDLPAAALRLSSFGLGLGWQLTARLLDDDNNPAEWGDHRVGPRQLLSRAGSAAGYITVLLFASGAVTMVVSLLSIRLCIVMHPGPSTSVHCLSRSRSLAVQALLAITAWPHNRAICSTKPLTSPSACHYNQRLFFAFNLARFLLPLAAGPPEPPQDNDECVAILLFCQLGIGMLVPLLIEAMAEARLFRCHQRQRHRQGLPLEGGWQAHMYGGIWWLTLGGVAPHLCLVYAMLLAACWDLCTVFALSASPGGPDAGGSPCS